MPFDEDAWRRDLRGFRREKDRYLKQHPHSPLPEAERGSFDGLAYYDPDPAYRLVVPLEETPSDERVTIPRTGGDEVTYLRRGTLHLDLPEGEVTLAAYETPGGREGELFVPFRDATSGTETYGAGRYLEVHQDEAADGLWVVDLNRAVSPFCAYDEGYTCPLPPQENRLEVPVRAGERHPW